MSFAGTSVGEAGPSQLNPLDQGQLVLRKDAKPKADVGVPQDP
jgi:hypothetical protein